MSKIYDKKHKCYHDDSDDIAWIEIDFEKNVPVKRVHIYMHDCCSDRLIPVFASLGADRIVWSDKIDLISSDCDFKIQSVGRVLRIEMKKNDFLHVRDIDVVSI